MTSQPALSYILGELPRVAFAAVRALEHAGTDAAAQLLDNTACRVFVAHEYAERAQASV